MKLVQRVVLFLFLTGAILGMSQQAHAQAKSSPNTNVLSVNFIPILFDDPIVLSFENKLGPKNSFEIRALYYGKNGLTGFGLGGGYRWYILDSRALTGLSVMPLGQIMFFSSKGSDRSTTVFELGGQLEYKWMFDELSIEPLVGFGIRFTGAESGSSDAGAHATIGVNIGLGW